MRKKLKEQQNLYGCLLFIIIMLAMVIMAISAPKPIADWAVLIIVLGIGFTLIVYKNKRR